MLVWKFAQATCFSFYWYGKKSGFAVKTDMKTYNKPQMDMV